MGSLCPLLLLPWALLSLYQPDVVLGCHTGTRRKCQSASFVPGYNLVGEGFDIVSMKRKGAYVINIETWEMANGRCRLCKNTQLGGAWQKVPLSVLDWRPRVNCRRSLTSKLYQSSESVLKDSTDSASGSWKVGLGLVGVGGLYVGGTHSKSARFAMEKSRSDKYSFASQDVNCKYYSFRLKDQPPLNTEFFKTLNSLPRIYNRCTATKFQHFIETYGTHYIHKVRLGGRVQSITAMRTCEAAMKGVTVHDIKNCLNVEASANIKGVTANAMAQFCRKTSKKLQRGQTFHSTFSDRKTEITGGLSSVHDILFSPEGPAAYKKWMDSLRTNPDIVSYALKPLHLLVRGNYIVQANLQRAVREYILKNALSRSCPNQCKVGRRNDPSNPCLCKCHGQTGIDSNCCPNKPGLAKLMVTVVRATGLWGDYFSKTDAYVKVFYGNQREETRVIWNNDFPYWGQQIKFGTVELSMFKPVKFEVWDRDNRWNDDLLGKCQYFPKRGKMEKKCGLKHGSLYVSLSVECAPSLGGEYCQSYVPSILSTDQAARYVGRNLMSIPEPFLSALQNQGRHFPANYTFGSLGLNLEGEVHAPSSYNHTE
ncbi:perforin-1 [Amia ocellicauda]|uniref:perforin-1 n=1 Tax=Amia ocellicauda TaxID=2972642 RepID=UPI0034647F7E|nr:PERF protein [Amia calva]